MALIDTAPAFVPARSKYGSRSPGRLLMMLLGILAGRGRSGAPTAAGSADTQRRRDPAGLLGRDVERWLDLMLRHRL